MKETKNVFMSELTEVFSKRQQQFVQFAYSYVRNREEAEDIVMGAFTNVWEHRNELQEDTNISALLLTAIKNRSLNHLQHLEVRTIQTSQPLRFTPIGISPFKITPLALACSWK